MCVRGCVGVGVGVDGVRCALVASIYTQKAGSVSLIFLSLSFSFLPPSALTLVSVSYSTHNSNNASHRAASKYRTARKAEDTRRYPKAVLEPCLQAGAAAPAWRRRRAPRRPHLPRPPRPQRHPRTISSLPPLTSCSSSSRASSSGRRERCLARRRARVRRRLLSLMSTTTGRRRMRKGTRLLFACLRLRRDRSQQQRCVSCSGPLVAPS